jgi:hypothetical protein
VAHRGGSLEGDFICSVTSCGILSGWTCNRAVWNKGAHGRVEATRSHPEHGSETPQSRWECIFRSCESSSLPGFRPVLWKQGTGPFFVEIE